MADPQKMLQTQLENIQKRSGKTLDELGTILKASGLSKHGELRDFLKTELGMGHGDANTLVHHLSTPSSAAPAGAGDELDAIYAGAKAVLRPIHEALMIKIDRFGDFEVAPKKANVSLRRKKQFALIGPATNTQVEVGLNMKGVPATDRLIAVPAGGMCNYKVRLAKTAEVDAELLAWIRLAYDGSA